MQNSFKREDKHISNFKKIFMYEKCIHTYFHISYHVYMPQHTLWWLYNSKLTNLLFFFGNIHFSYVIPTSSLPGLYNGYNLVCIVFTENSVFLSQRLLTQLFHGDLLHMLLYVVMVSQAPSVSFTLNKPQILIVSVLGKREKEKKRISLPEQKVG